MSDYKDIIRKPETLNWFRAAMAINITRDCLLDIVKQASQELYHTIRKEINRKHGILENVVCSHCNTPNVLPCDAHNKCCHYKYGGCTFHDIHKPRNCPTYLCNEICKEIVNHHRFRNTSKPNSFQGPTWVNTDACKWCGDPWQIAKCYLSKDGYKDVNKVEEADFNGIVNLMYNCEFFQMYFKDDLTQKENVCIKARDVRHAVCHSPPMSMTSPDIDRAIDTLVSLLKSLKHVNHQAASKAAVEQLTQLKNGTLAITTEDVATTFQHLKENLIAQIKEALEKEKDKLVKEMVDALNENISKSLETIQRKEDDVLQTVQSKGDDVLKTVQRKGDGVLEKVQSKGDDVIGTVHSKGDEVLEKVQSKGDDTLEKVQSKGDEELEKVQSKGDDVLEKVQSKGDEVLEKVESKGDDVLEKVQSKGDDVLEKVQSKGDDVLEKVQSKGDHVLGTVQSKGDKELEKVQSKGDEVLGTVQSKGDDVLEKVQSKGDDVLGTVQSKEDEVLEKVQSKGDKVLEKVQSKGDDVLEKVQRKGDGVLETIRRKENELLNKNATRNSVLAEIQSWLIEQYRAMCVMPVSMLDPDIDVPLERIYVPPSIKELKRGQGTTTTSRAGTDLSCYKELLHRDGNQASTIYIQGDAGSGKTTFSTKLVLDWCNAHSEHCTSTSKNISKETSTSEGTSKQKHISDLDTLRDYTFLFFVSLRDYSGTMCNVSQMVEDAIKSNKLAWDDSVWEHKCIVLTDAADEWYHPDIPFPPPCDSACKCRKDRSMPLYLQRSNITNIITARPWKLANLSMSDTLTRMFEIIGVANYETLAKNVMNVLAEKDGISKNDQQRKRIDFFRKIEAQSLNNLIKTPAVCVQLAHQFYVGRLMEGSLCAIYINMLDMHIAKGLQKLQIKEFDTEEICVKEITQIFGTESTEYLRDNGSLIRSASALAFKTLTDSSKESSLVFAEKKITNHMTKTTLDYLLQTGIITKKKSLALSSQKNVPYMFVHKTIQEFLASLYIAINHMDIEDVMNAIQSVYCDGESILDIGQLFIFTCGMCAPAAKRMSKHIMDVITRDMDSMLQSSLGMDYLFTAEEFKAEEATQIVMDGFMEGAANKQPCLQLTLSHVKFILGQEDRQKNKEIEYKHALNTLIDMNISNIISIDASIQQDSYRVQKIISHSRESLSYLRLYEAGQLDLQGLKLKFLSCWGGSDISNLDCTYMRACEMYIPTILSEEGILQSMSVTGKNIRYLKLVRVKDIDLVCTALPNLTSLHTLILYCTENIELYYLPESIRKVVYELVDVSAQDVKSMVEWSKSRDACVCCELLNCKISDNGADICTYMKQQDGIDITRCELQEVKRKPLHYISISWNTILSK